LILIVSKLADQHVKDAQYDEKSFTNLVDKIVATHRDHQGLIEAIYRARSNFDRTWIQAGLFPASPPKPSNVKDLVYVLDKLVCFISDEERSWLQFRRNSLMAEMTAGEVSDAFSTHIAAYYT